MRWLISPRCEGHLALPPSLPSSLALEWLRNGAWHVRDMLVGGAATRIQGTLNINPAPGWSLGWVHTIPKNSPTPFGAIQEAGWAGVPISGCLPCATGRSVTPCPTAETMGDCHSATGGTMSPSAPVELCHCWYILRSFISSWVLNSRVEGSCHKCETVLVCGELHKPHEMPCEMPCFQYVGPPT